jgi:16S rRNA processing protein RimM
MSDGAPAAELVRMGRVAGAHGLRGAIKLRLDNPVSDTISRLSRIMIELGGTRRDFRILGVARAGGGMLRVTLEGVGDADAAAALAGGIAMARAEDLPALGPREFYYRDLIGCEVRTVDGRVLGTVAEVFSAGANDVMIVRGGAGEVLVPAIEDVVKSMDLKERRVVIEPVPGLLD